MRLRHWGRASAVSSIATPGAAEAGSRVRGIVDLRQMLEIEVGVHLGGADVGMPQELLDPAQIAAGLEQVRCEGVADHVRVYVNAQPLPARPQVAPQLHGPRREPPPAAAQEDRALVSPRRRLRASSSGSPQKSGTLLEPV